MFLNDQKSEKEANRIFYGALATLCAFVLFAVYFVGM